MNARGYTQICVQPIIIIIIIIIIIVIISD